MKYYIKLYQNNVLIVSEHDTVSSMKYVYKHFILWLKHIVDHAWGYQVHKQECFKLETFPQRPN